MMENQPLVSVIMPCYNMEKFIAYTIQSVQGQTYPHWELCIVDDASTDKTAEIVKNIQNQDDRIHFLVKPKHSGIADTRNQCIQMAQGRYLAFLDSDDFFRFFLYGESSSLIGIANTAFDEYTFFIGFFSYT